jgi:Pvc16 N-terminal domain
MSNYLAIATVTHALQALLDRPAKDAVASATVTTTRPSSAPAAFNGAGVNIFLYQALPNSQYRNADLPTRRSDGQLTQRPQAALVLRYMLSFWGSDSTLDAHLLMGAVINQLHAKPVLSAKQIQDTIIAWPSVTASNLADQTDLIRFTPLSLSIEDLSKLWSTFFQVPYVLSVAYEASPILIETDDTPLQALPVKARNLYVLPFRQPQIDTVVSQAGDSAPIFADTVLVIRGKQFQSDDTHVLLAGESREPQSVTDSQIALPMPPGIQAGVQAIQTIQKLALGTPPQPHPGFESNVATFVLRPRIKKPAAHTNVGGPGLEIEVDVSIGPSQRVVLLLNSTATGDGLAYSFVAAPRKSVVSVITVMTPEVAAGTYFVRVQIDGATSPLELDPRALGFGPVVVMP